MFLVGLVAAMVSCNKDDNMDYFCNAVSSKDWVAVEVSMATEVIGYADADWRRNVQAFAETLVEKECVESAQPSYNLIETIPLRTDVNIFFDVNDTLQRSRVALVVDNLTGLISMPKTSQDSLEYLYVY